MMLKSYKVVHLAKTPLVGAPGKISRALNEKEIASSSYCNVDYPNNGPLYKFFTDNTTVLSEIPVDVYDFFLEDVRQSDIIHIHNDFDLKLLKTIVSISPNAEFVYQVHSPLREGPLFLDRSDSLGIVFSKKLVVAQYQPRHYQDFHLVPNLVLDNSSFKPRLHKEKLKVLFSPSHGRSGRWNAKRSDILDDLLASLNKNKKIELVMPSKPVSPSVLMLMRRNVDVTIDEIVTGAYHQVSLEGLCAGNVVINRADYFSKCMLRNIADASLLPPFVYADDSNVFDVIMSFSDNVDLTNDVKKASFDYFNEYLESELLIDRFVEVYDGLF